MFSSLNMFGQNSPKQPSDDWSFWQYTLLPTTNRRVKETLKRSVEEYYKMKRQANAFVLSSLLVSCLSLFAQQKGQWVPVQSRLNAGVLPDAGFTFANLTL